MIQVASSARRRLEKSATLAQVLSEQLCHTPNGRDQCGALHGIWPDLRLLELAAEPARHASFYAQALGKRVANRDSRRVLVCGCADWGMLETVVAAYRDAPLDVTVVDRCATPVMLCAWYGSEIGLPVRTAVGDVITWGESQTYDVICTHSLLIYLAIEGRRQLVANWARLLRPGGAVITVSRLTKESMPAEVDDELAHRFGDFVLQRTGQLGLDRDLAVLRARAERFAKAQVSHPVGSEADLSELFERQGFEVDRLDVRQLAGMMPAGEPVGAARTGEYGEIVAVRR
jgi:2-polyprenyl-3-methyl-5-hydroxy-6-metoxy-1,4-benzoquinol methylase